LAGAKGFLFHNASYLAPNIYPASFVVGTKGPFPAHKGTGMWSWLLTSI